MIDVIINCYNDSEVILDSLSSVLNQSFYHKINTIIIMDDGSTDNTQDIIFKIKNNKIKYIYQKNSGISNARNNAIKNCTSQYIAFLDADDIWAKNKLEEQYTVISNNPEIDFIYTNVNGFYNYWPAVEVELFRCISYNGKGHHLSYFLHDAPIFPSTLFIKLSIVQTLDGFDETLKKSEDTDFCLRLLESAYSYHLTDPLVFRRLSSNSLGSDGEDLLPYQQQIENKLLLQFPSYSNLIPRRKARFYFTIAKEKLTKFEDAQKCRYFLGLLLKIQPLHFEGILLYLVSCLPLVSKKGNINKIKQIYKKLTFKYSPKKST